MRETAFLPNETALDLESLAADVVVLATKAGAGADQSSAFVARVDSCDCALLQLNRPVAIG